MLTSDKHRYRDSYSWPTRCNRRVDWHGDQRESEQEQVWTDCDRYYNRWRRVLIKVNKSHCWLIYAPITSQNIKQYLYVPICISMYGEHFVCCWRYCCEWDTLALIVYRYTKYWWCHQHSPVPVVVVVCCL